MKKLRLDVDSLAVEQFATDAADEKGAAPAPMLEATKWWSGCPAVHTCLC